MQMQCFSNKTMKENGLIHAWLGEQLDRLPQVFLPELKRQWNVSPAMKS